MTILSIATSPYDTDRQVMLHGSVADKPSNGRNAAAKVPMLLQQYGTRPSLASPAAAPIMAHSATPTLMNFIGMAVDELI